MTNPSFATDQPTKVDLFKRKPFAEAFAKSLCLKKDAHGLVVAIEGPWGSGKTSVINFIKSELQKNSAQPLIIEFNPWMISGSEALVEIMLTQLASAIGETKQKTKKGLETAEKIVQYAELLKFLKYVPTLSWAGNIAEDATSAAGTVTKGLKELLPALDLTKAKIEVEKKLSHLNKPIVVIIDDIDRLTYSEIRHLFQAIKSVADFPRVTYLLAYDLNQIATALDQEFGQGRGRSYIEKIVQIAYPIPVLMPLQMLAYTQSKIDDLFTRLDVKLRPYEQKYLDQILGLIVSLQKTPRDMVRLINRLVIAVPNTRSDINICDVIVLEAISLKYEYLRTLLYQRPEIFTGRFWVSDERGHDFDLSQLIGVDKEKNRNKWIEELPKDEVDRKVLTKAFKFLFPNLNEARGAGEVELDELRVAATDRLKRYFALTTLDDSVSAADIHALFQYPDRLETYLDFNDETITKQLSDLRAYAGSAQILDFDHVIQILIDKTNYLCRQKDINKSLLELLADLLMKVLSKALTNKDTYFFKIIAETPLSISMTLINTATSDLDLWRGGANQIEHPLIQDVKVVKDAQRQWVNKISKESQSNSFLEHLNAVELVWTWGHLVEDKSELKQTIKKFFTGSKTRDLAVTKLLPLRGSINDVSEISFIWNPKELENILKSNHAYAEKYKALIEQLSQENLIEWFEKQNTPKL